MSDDNVQRIRNLRERHFGPKPSHEQPASVADTEKHLGDRVDALQTKYEMELAAHRDTTQRLLAEKDAVIELLRQRIADLESTRSPQADI